MRGQMESTWINKMSLDSGFEPPTLTVRNFAKSGSGRGIYDKKRIGPRGVGQASSEPISCLLPEMAVICPQNSSHKSLEIHNDTAVIYFFIIKNSKYFSDTIMAFF